MLSPFVLLIVSADFYENSPKKTFEKYFCMGFIFVLNMKRGVSRKCLNTRSAHACTHEGGLLSGVPLGHQQRTHRVPRVLCWLVPGVPGMDLMFRISYSNQ